MFNHVDGDQVIWPDGRRERVDTILLATGYRPALGYLALGALGAPRHSRGLSCTPTPASTTSASNGNALCLRHPARRRPRRRLPHHAPLAAHLRKPPLRRPAAPLTRTAWGPNQTSTPRRDAVIAVFAAFGEHHVPLAVRGAVGKDAAAGEPAARTTGRCSSRCRDWSRPGVLLQAGVDSGGDVGAPLHDPAVALALPGSRDQTCGREPARPISCLPHSHSASGSSPFGATIELCVTTTRWSPRDGAWLSKMASSE